MHHYLLPQRENHNCPTQVMQGLDLSNDYIGISVITKKVTRVITLTINNLLLTKESLASNSFLELVKTRVTYTLIYTIYIHMVGTYAYE